jgi:signal peptidase I
MKFNLKESIRKNTSFLIFLLLVFAFRWSFADQYQVPTGSMEPTIHVGDRILVNKLAYNLKVPFTDLILQPMDEPKRGDIVVFKSPEAEGLTLVKRLIGLPGDHIQIQNGFIKINGQPLKGTDLGIAKLQLPKISEAEEIFYPESIGEYNVVIKRLPHRVRAESLEFDVPADQYFMMGDNRDNSFDSRYWGFAPRENLKGKALRVLWNFSVSEFRPRVELERFGKKF